MDSECDPVSHNQSRRRGQRAIRFLILLLLTLFCSREAHASQLHLRWVDTATNEFGFQIERKVGGDGTFVHVATVSANLTSYTDSDLIPGTTYCYRVQAFNAAGSSPYSNEACATASSLMAVLESPEDGLPVAGIAVVRGWAFDTRVGGQISSVDLLIDGVRMGDAPCCSARGDVQAAFSQFPATNTLNSGWGITFNWGVLSAGSHTLQAEIRSSDGQVLSTETRSVTVVKPAESEFLEAFSLSDAAASIEGETLLVEGIVVRDKTTQTQKRIDARFRWVSSAQAFGLVDAITTAELTAVHPWSPRFASSVWERIAKWLAPSVAQATAGIRAELESPEEARAVSGVSVVRGWAFAEESGDSVQEIRLVIDGQLSGAVPCCSIREDVAVAFSGQPQTQSSGWGTTLNYGLLPSGFHQIEVQVRGRSGTSLTLRRGVTVVQIGGFEFLDEFAVSDATARIEGDTLIVVEGVQIRDRAGGQMKVVDIFLQWSVSDQALGVVAATG